VQKDELTLYEMTQLMVEKLKLIFYIHSSVLEDVDQAQTRQHRSYAAWKGKQEFSGLEAGRTNGEDEKAKEKENTTCKLGTFVFLCETQRREGLQKV
jgi:hypothetical protein